MTTRQEIIDALEEQRALVIRLVATTPPDAWSSGAHENGWNARELLAHVATTSRVAGFVLAMINAPPGSITSGGTAFDQDIYNAQQVAARASKSVQEVGDEILANFASDALALRSAPDELLARHYKAPWETEDPVADVILASIREHNRMHLSDLSAALHA